MARQYICQYGNCHENEVPFTVSRKDQGTQRFCCELHAAASLLNDAQMRAGWNNEASEAIRLAKQPVIELAEKKR